MARLGAATRRLEESMPNLVLPCDQLRLGWPPQSKGRDFPDGDRSEAVPPKFKGMIVLCLENSQAVPSLAGCEPPMEKMVRLGGTCPKNIRRGDRKIAGSVCGVRSRSGRLGPYTSRVAGGSGLAKARRSPRARRIHTWNKCSQGRRSAQERRRSPFPTGSSF